MKSLVIDIWLRIRASYWFIPSLMVIAATIAAIALVNLEDEARALIGDRFPALLDSQPQGIQALLSTIAGSMITVAGVTFSMTLLAVSHATAQIGPGLLTGFMRDRGNQITLGTFVATFVYCLLVLRVVHGSADDAEAAMAVIPHLATAGALLMAVLSVGWLIYFFHHVPQSINVVRLVANVGDDRLRAIGAHYPSATDDSSDIPDAWPFTATEDTDNVTSVTADQDGYIRVIDFDGLARFAAEADIRVRMLARPGDYLLPGQPLLEVNTDAVDREMRDCLLEYFSLGPERTVEQDVLLPIEQLLEVMGKALSPGINNQHTAIHCVDQLFRALAEVLARRAPCPAHQTEEGSSRIALKVVSQEELVRAVCMPIRQYIAGDWITTRYLLTRIDALLTDDRYARQATSNDETGRQALAEQRDAIMAEAAESAMPTGLRESL